MCSFKLGIINSDKLKKLGWCPKISLEDGFKRTVEYIEREAKIEKEN